MLNIDADEARLKKLLSSGHRAVSDLLNTNGMMAATQPYYGAVVSGQASVAAQIAAGVNAQRRPTTRPPRFS